MKTVVNHFGQGTLGVTATCKRTMLTLTDKVYATFSGLECLDLSCVQTMKLLEWLSNDVSKVEIPSMDSTPT